MHRRRTVLAALAPLPALFALGALVACRVSDSPLGAARQPSPAVAVAAPVPHLEPASGQGSGSTIALARVGRRRLALVADSESHALRLLDTRSGEELPEVHLPGAPSQLVMAPDGRVFVAVRDEAEVDVLDQAPAAAGEPLALRVAERIATADEPVGLALTPDGRTLLVASGWGRALDAFATRSLAHLFRAPLAREPRAVVASADGLRAYVAHASASLVSVVDLASPVHAVGPVLLEQPNPDRPGHALAWRQGFALARAGSGILAPGVTVDTGETTMLSDTYGGVGEDSLPAESFGIARVQVPAPGGPVDGPAGLGELTEEPRIEQPPVACLLPRAAAYDDAGESLFVACQGTDTVMRVDARADTPGVRFSEWKVGEEPTGIALDEERRTVFVWSQVSRTVTGFAMGGETKGDAARGKDFTPGEDYATFALGPALVPDAASAQVALGRALFHRTGDARIAGDGRACASCHPEGRDDGLVWATPDGPRQTPSLAGRLAGTAPYGWNGARGTVKQHVTNTLRRLGGAGLDDESMDALVAYCMTMAAPPKPGAHDAGAKSAESAKQEAPLVAEGRDLFESTAAGCSSCHIEDGTFTDGNRHDIHSRASGDPGRRFDTPSLRFVGDTAPYFHDGRYPTLRALLIASDGRMGHTAQLSSHQLDALEAYLRTL